MQRRTAERILLLASVLAPFLFVGIAELLVRIFSDIDLLGNSRNLFVAEAYGSSMGNTPNVEAISFDQVVYTDEHGFRVPKGGTPEDADKREALLILGDSIGFGPAIEERDTFAGLLRARFPRTRIYNSSVIGYATPDYKNVVKAFLPLHKEVTTIVLAFSLNDISSSSAQNIDRYLTNANDEIIPERRLTETLRSVRWLSDANDFLRSRSKLYLLLRHHLLGTQMRDWKAVSSVYVNDSAGAVERSMEDIAEIARMSKERGIRFIAVLCPFEYQLRKPEDPETQVPQRRVGELLAKAGVETIDPRPYFDASVPSTDYFLAYDEAHMSALGNRVIADVITEALER
jgi:hypothetical protein